MPEILTPADFYNNANETLFLRGKYGYGEAAHYLNGYVDLVEPGRHPHPMSGQYQVTNYHSNDSLHFRQTGNTPEDQRRLLEIGRSIISIGLYNQYGDREPITYTICHPSDVRPNSTIGRFFYRRDQSKRAPIECWRDDEPLIVRAFQHPPVYKEPVYEVVCKPHAQPQLQRIHQDLQARNWGRAA